MQFGEVHKLTIATLGDNKIAVSTTSDDQTKVNVYDLTGKKVFTTNEANPVIQLNKPGVYVIELEGNYTNQTVKHLVR